jgi:hypothetical protein
MPGTRSDAITTAFDALAGLERLGETVDDDWQYVVDLARAWRLKLEAAAAAAGDEPLADDRTHAIEVAAVEAASITDPHRAIDWLSTLPQIVLLALGDG